MTFIWQGHSAGIKQMCIVMTVTILTSKEFYSENPTLHTLNVDNSLQFKKGYFIGKYGHSCVSIIITLKFFRVKKPQTKLKIIRILSMKTKAIIATGLVTLALLAGCNKAEEPKATKTQESTSSTSTVTPSAPTGEPPATKTEESTSTTTTAPAPATEGK